MPSVGLHPAGHADRSILKPSGPVTVLPSAEVPQPLSSMRSTVAARCSAHRASHASMLWGPSSAGTVVEVASWLATPDFTPESMVPVDWASSLSEPPQAAARSDAAARTATNPPVRPWCRCPPRCRWRVETPLMSPP